MIERLLELVDQVRRLESTRLSLEDERDKLKKDQARLQHERDAATAEVLKLRAALAQPHN